MAGLTLGGLASGMDTDAVISQLMAIEARGKTRLIGRQYAAEARRNALDQIATKLRSFMTAADDLRSVGSWATVQKVESSDTARIGATFKSGAATGIYSIEVVQLARAEQRFYNHPATTTRAGTITIDGQAIAVGSGWTADQTAAAINGTSGATAYASVVDGQLVLSGKQTGVALNVTITGTPPPNISEDTGKLRTAQSAIYKIDGVTQAQSTSNTVTGLTGVELQLKSLTTTPVTVNVGVPGPDQEGLETKVKAFIEAYNSTIDLIKNKLEETPVKDPKSQAEYGRGVLRGDTGLQVLLSRLRAAMSDKIPGNAEEFNQLSDIGITVPSAQTSGKVSADRLAGKLVFDEDAFSAALAADPLAVKRFMGGEGGVAGFTQTLDGLVDPVARLTDGDLAKRVTISDREIARLKDQQLQMDARLKLKEERLRRQFAAMETALNQSQTMTSWLNGQIAGLTVSS